MNTAVTASQGSQSTQWQIDSAHSGAHFTVRHLMIANVRGEFTKLTGSAVIDPTDITKSSVDIQIEAGSVSTREPQRDDHLRSADFLDVAKYPQITFRSKQIKSLGSEHATVIGDLSIHGVTKEVAFDLEGPTRSIKDPWGNTRAGVTATAKISRKEFGLTFNPLTETGGFMIGDEVKLSLEAEIVQKAPSA